MPLNSTACSTAPLTVCGVMPGFRSLANTKREKSSSTRIERMPMPPVSGRWPPDAGRSLSADLGTELGESRSAATAVARRGCGGRPDGSNWSRSG